MDCLACGKTIRDAEVRRIIGEEKVETALLDFAKQAGIISCGKCRIPTFIEPSPVDYQIKDSKGRLYSRAAAECFARFRFKCPQCRTEQCGGCSAVPYHEGMTCEENKQEKCRYCEERPIVADDCCSDSECQRSLSLSCKFRLSCDHRCFGLSGEELCHVCYTCESTGNDFCPVCGTEKLRNKPVITLICNHAIHLDCLRAVLGKKWTTARITFGFARCPLCKRWAMPVSNTEIATKVAEFQSLYEKIVTKGKERLAFEPEERKAVETEGSRYFHQTEQYIMDRFCFYECFRCKSLYFGGKKECEAGEVPPQAPSDYLCPNCTEVIPGFIPGQKNCPLHGIDFIEYKCRFCCSVAVYYCWGTTHFCEACHKRHNSGDSLTDKKPHRLPQCSGQHDCKLRVKHPPNGTVEFVLGCGLCSKARSGHP